MDKFPHSVRTKYMGRGQSRYLSSPFKPRDLRPLNPDGEIVGVYLPCSDKDFRRLSRLIVNSPKSCLVIDSKWYRPRKPATLDFLENFSGLRRLMINFLELPDLEGIRHAGNDLEELQLGWLKRTKRHSLRFLTRFRRLKVLWLEGPAPDIEVLGELKGLKELNLYCGAVADLSKLKSLNSLQVLSLTNGGAQDLDMLPVMPNLRHLALRGVAGLRDLSRLTEFRSLRFIWLQDLKNVSSLPSFAKLKSLGRVQLNTLKSVRDLRPIARAPSLEELDIEGMSQLTPDDFRCFIGHQRLQSVTAAIGSLRRKNAVDALLGLPS